MLIPPMREKSPPNAYAPANIIPPGKLSSRCWVSTWVHQVVPSPISSNPEVFDASWVFMKMLVTVTSGEGSHTPPAASVL